MGHSTDVVYTRKYLRLLIFFFGGGKIYIASNNILHTYYIHRIHHGVCSRTVYFLEVDRRFTNGSFGKYL